MELLFLCRASLLALIATYLANPLTRPLPSPSVNPTPRDILQIYSNPPTFFHLVREVSVGDACTNMVLPSIIWLLVCVRNVGQLDCNTQIRFPASVERCVLHFGSRVGGRAGGRRLLM